MWNMLHTKLEFFSPHFQTVQGKELVWLSKIHCRILAWSRILEIRRLKSRSSKYFTGISVRCSIYSKRIHIEDRLFSTLSWFLIILKGSVKIVKIIVKEQQILNGQSLESGVGTSEDKVLNDYISDVLPLLYLFYILIWIVCLCLMFS